MIGAILPTRHSQVAKLSCRGLHITSRAADRAAVVPAASFPNYSYPICTRAQGNKQYEADHDNGLQKSNSIVFNAFIFMQVRSKPVVILNMHLPHARLADEYRLLCNTSCCEETVTNAY